MKKRIRLYMDYKESRQKIMEEEVVDKLFPIIAKNDNFTDALYEVMNNKKFTKKEKIEMIFLYGRCLGQEDYIRYRKKNMSHYR